MRFYVALFLVAVVSLPILTFLLRSLLPWIAMMSVVLLVLACWYAARAISTSANQDS